MLKTIRPLRPFRALLRRPPFLPLLLSLMLPLQVHVEPAADFDFRFQYGICSTSELDTFTGWFTRERADGTSAMVQLSLNASQMRHLYETLTKIDFFHYPSVFQPRQGPPTIFSNGFWVVRYQMNVRSDGRMHSVQWDDDQTDRGPQADRLRRLFGWAVAFINEAAEAKHLPPPCVPRLVHFRPRCQPSPIDITSDGVHRLVEANGMPLDENV